LNLRKLRRKNPLSLNVLNAQGLGIYELTVGISSREKGRHIIRLLVMSPKKKNLLLQNSF
jgi:hypothetical protein